MYIWKTIKLFLSSTFLDLELERDQLAEAFSKLRLELASRRLSLTPYDLRWRHRRSEQPVAQWCVEMVQQCEFFIGIIGSRYGWRPPVDAWGEPNTSKISVTEMEIKEALQTIEPAKRFFCFLPLDEELRGEDRASLEKLKEKLKRQGESIFDVQDMPELLLCVQNEIRLRIDKCYPPQTKCDFVEYTRRDTLEEFLREKQRGFIGRDSDLLYLDSFCEQDKSPSLLIKAPAGTGKSSLLAHWICNHPRKEHLVTHFLGMGGGSHQVREIITHLLEQLRDLGEIENIAQDPLEARSQLRKTLEKPSQPLIVVLDALDEVEESGKSLIWLPTKLGDNVKLIISARPVHHIEDFTHNTWNILDLAPLDDEETEKIIDYYGQQLQIDLGLSERKLLKERCAGNPLFLKVALEEIGSGGLAVGQLANSIENLFEQILQRISDNYGESIILDYLGLIAGSLTGLVEHELQELLAEHSSEKNVSDDLVLEVHKALENFLIQRQGLYQFFHAEFERTIKQRLGRARMRDYHNRLVNYFVGKGFHYERTLLEICYQQQWAENFPDLAMTLTNIDFLQSKCQAGMLDLLLEDFENALYGNTFALPSQTYHVHSAILERPSIIILMKALQLEAKFLRQYPEELFSCLWNRLFWFHNSEAEHHYLQKEKNVPNFALPSLANAWQERCEGKIWLQSKRPSYPDLGLPIEKVYQGHLQGVSALAICLSRGKVISGDIDGWIRIWDLESSECLVEMQEHQGRVYHIAVSDDGRRFISVGEDGMLFVWDTDSGECLQILESPGNCLSSAVFVGNSFVISGSLDQKIQQWNLSSGDSDDLFVETGNLLTMALASSQEFLITGDKEGTVEKWDLTNKTRNSLIKENRFIYQVSISPCDRYVVYACKNQSVKVFDLQTNKVVSNFIEHKSEVIAADFVDQKTIISASSNQVFVHNWSDNRILSSFFQPEWQISQLALWKSNFFCGSRSGNIALWEPSNALRGLRPRRLKGHQERIHGCTYSPNQEIVASYSKDCNICLWDIKTGGWKRSLVGHNRIILNAAFSENSQKLVSGSEDGEVCLWDVEAGSPIHRLSGHKGVVSHVAFFNQDQGALSIGFYDNSIRIWDVFSGKCLEVLEEHKKWIEDISLHHSKNLLATASRDCTIKLWDLQNFTCHKTIRGHKSSVMAISFNRGGNKVACGDYKGNVYIWDLETERCLMTFNACSRKIIEVRFSVCENYLYSYAEDGCTRVWDLQVGVEKEVITGRMSLDDVVGESDFYSVVGRWQTKVVAKTDNKVVARWPDNLLSPRFMNSYLVAGSRLYPTQMYFFDLVSS